MSSKFSLLASAMPTFTKKTTVEAKVDALTDYQVQLLDYLRYTLGNLDKENFNPSGLNEILEPVVVEIKNAEGDILALRMTAEELAGRIEDVDGNYASLQMTVEGLETEISSVDGKYTSISATVNGIQSTVSSHTTTLNSHTTSINNQAATNTSLQSQITQTANKISAVVSAVDDSSGNVTAASIVAAINSAGSSVQISADHISLSGVVTVSDLRGNGTVEINAGNIMAGGTISGCALESTGDYYWQQVSIANGQIYFYSGAIYDDSYGDIMLYSSDTLHLQSWNSNVRIYPGTTAYWEFRSSGIYWCDRYGNVMNSVALNGG